MILPCKSYGRGLKKRSFFLAIVLLLAGCLLFPAPAQASEPEPNGTETTRILFIFDASFSMYGQWQSGMKMDIAKRMLTEFLDSLKTIPNLEIAFRAYGHQYKLTPKKNCEDTKLEVPFASPSKAVPLIKQKLLTIVPTGTTPIAYTLGQCAADFTPCGNCRNVVILITDGIEECDGNPCEVSMELQRKGIILRPFVIGIGMDESFMQSFSCIGKYFDVSNEVNFKSVMQQALTLSLSNTTVQVSLLDQSKKPTETDVNMTLYDANTGAIKYNYLHTLNSRGNPDTLVIDPGINYRLVVHTIPKVEKNNITITQGKHNIIAVDAPQGYLKLKVNGTTNYKSLYCVVRKSGEMKTLHVQEFNQTEKYITGKYDLEILTLPRIYYPNADISQSKTTTIEIPESGMVSLQKPTDGPGSIYLEEKNKLVWVCNMKENILNENVVLQPGNYRAVYRPKNSREVEYTVEKQFKIESGSTTAVRFQ
jgi:Ca-activated chloride channel family protein